MAEVIFFDGGASPSFGWLSNYSKHSFRCKEGLHWTTVEHYFQAQKFYGDAGHMEAIRMASSAKEAKQLGQSREHRLREGYEGMKDEIMLQALRLKFAAHPDLKRRLLGTKGSYLAEYSEKDQYWGTLRDFSGKNRLGELLMQLRQELGGNAAPPKPSSTSEMAAVTAATATTLPATSASRSVPVARPAGDVEKSYEAAVIVMPPKEQWAQIQAIRQKYDKAFVRWMPHINLLFPFVAEGAFSPAMEERLRLALGQLEPFDVELAGFSTFEHSRSNVMFCQPVTTPNKKALHELYDTLIGVFPGCAADRPYHPHLTVGQFAKNQCDHKMSEFSSSWKPIRWTCDRIEIIRRAGSTPFEITKTVGLGAAANSDVSLHSEMEETLRSRLLLWLHKMNGQNQLPRTTEKLANAIANMSFVSYKATAELLYQELLEDGYVSVDSSGGAIVHSVAANNYRSEYSTVGQSYHYHGMGSTNLHSTEASSTQLVLPTRLELTAMAKDRSIRWVGGLRGFTGNAKSFFNQLKHMCTFKVLLEARDVVTYLVDSNVVTLAPDDCTKILAYNL